MIPTSINKTVMTKETLQQIPQRPSKLRSQQPHQQEQQQQQQQSKENPAINVNAQRKRIPIINTKPKNATDG